MNQKEQLVKAVQAYHPTPDLDLLGRAFDFSQTKHSGQIRASGEPYFNHLVETSLLICQLKLDVPSIAAALLHDTIEDCGVTREELLKEFGADIADIVEGVTKLTRIEFESREEKQAESFRKMLIAMSKDIRVVLVKLCDRLHNMRTLGFVPEAKQRRQAQETIEIYAPLANRLGIHWLKSELEDWCLRYSRPEIFKLIQENVEKQVGAWDKYINEASALIKSHLDAAGVSAAVHGRKKHYYSIWRKMEQDNLSYDEVYDIIGFRVVVSTIRACYEVLGIMHATFKPVPGRFKDYIAMPKPNMYQSLHTTVIGPDGQRIEIQIRTPEMHKVAEEGIAAHWRYKESGTLAYTGFDLKWVTELVETQQYLKNPDEFIQSVKGELFPEEVFVFTPRGDLFRLTADSTPIDFAYAVHTDVGHRATGAKCNGLMVPLDHKLENGDTVEIVTAKNHVPSKDWLRFVRTSKAKQRIRAFLKAEENAKSLALGVELLTKDLRKVRLSIKKLESDGRLGEVAKELGYRSESELYAEIGYGKVTTTKVLAKLLPEGADVESKLRREASPLQRIFQRAAQASRLKVGVKVGGIDDILVRFAKCCEPLPGDRIVGFITRGRGVTVHYADCPHALQLDPLRKVDVTWDTHTHASRRVKLIVHSQDQIGLLANVTSAITANGANIVSAAIKTSGLGKAVNSFELSVGTASQLAGIVRGIEKVPGVIKVERVKEFDKKSATGALDDEEISFDE